MQLAKECAELGRVLKNSRCIHGNIRDEAVLVIEHPTDTGFEAKLLLGDFSQAQEANEDGRALVPLPGALTGKWTIVHHDRRDGWQPSCSLPETQSTVHTSANLMQTVPQGIIVANCLCWFECRHRRCTSDHTSLVPIACVPSILLSPVLLYY